MWKKFRSVGDQGFWDSAAYFSQAASSAQKFLRFATKPTATDRWKSVSMKSNTSIFLRQ
jgi:cytochrome c551/c552